MMPELFNKLSQTSTGIFQINQTQNFSIYPNPSNGNFTINVKNKNAASIEIYNVMGEKIFSAKLMNPKTEIELNAKPGMYFYQIKNDNGIIENSKIVIQ